MERSRRKDGYRTRFGSELMCEVIARGQQSTDLNNAGPSMTDRT